MVKKLRRIKKTKPGTTARRIHDERKPEVARKWEVVVEGEQVGTARAYTYRLKVPGGWLYAHSQWMPALVSSESDHLVSNVLEFVPDA